MRMTVRAHHRRLIRAFRMVMLLALLGALPAAAGAAVLSDAFTAASPGSGYDTMLVLDGATIYTGGLSLPAGHHCIMGNGAVINLQGLSVEAGDGVILDVSGCSFTNGNMGLDFTAGSMGHVECCNFINNYDGLRAWEGSSVTLASCNFVNNNHYGVYRHEFGAVHNSFNNAWSNTTNDYVYFCPG